MNTLLLNHSADAGRGVHHPRSPADLVVIGARQPGYPAEWEIDAVLADGGPVHVRPIRPDDAEAHRAFFAHQSEQSVYFRFFGHRSALTEREVTHFTTVDYHDRMAFVAFLNDDLIGIGRYDRLAGCDAAEVAFAVADEHQGRGLATMLLAHLAAYAATTGITRFSAETLIDNRRMLDVFQRAGFRRESASIEYGVVRLTVDVAIASLPVRR
jgi:RimJ/RimL family protein N-acetyltransferase